MTTIDLPATGAAPLTTPEGAVVLGGQPPVVNQNPGFVPPTPTQPLVVVPSPTQSTNEYVVQRGDSLARIARTRLGAESRWQEIAALNPKVDPKSLDVGQKLLLPAGAAPTVAKPTAPRASEPKTVAKSTSKPVSAATSTKKSDKPAAAGRACIVQKGDTLRSIARRELGDERRWKEIASANPGLDPAKLAIGMRVKLPQKGGELLAAAGPAPTASNKPRVR